jgi:hypothetical protein
LVWFLLPILLIAGPGEGEGEELAHGGVVLDDQHPSPVSGVPSARHRRRVSPPVLRAEQRRPAGHSGDEHGEARRDEGAGRNYEEYQG